MRKQLLVGVGALLVMLGALWTAQGLGWIGGSAMSGQTTWAVVGPLVALVGVAMAVSGLRATRQSQ
jgi:hypothetical protein